jgi:hypothetical protein
MKHIKLCSYLIKERKTKNQKPQLNKFHLSKNS